MRRCSSRQRTPQVPQKRTRRFIVIPPWGHFPSTASSKVINPSNRSPLEIRAGGFNKRTWRRRSSVHAVRARTNFLTALVSFRCFSRECPPEKQTQRVLRRLPAPPSGPDKARNVRFFSASFCRESSAQWQPFAVESARSATSSLKFDPVREPFLLASSQERLRCAIPKSPSPVLDIDVEQRFYGNKYF